MRNSTNLNQLPNGNVVFSKVKWIGLTLSLFMLLMINYTPSQAQCNVSVTVQKLSNFNGADVSCYGSLDGSIKALPTGGASLQYQYAWATNTAIPIPGNSQVWYNLSAGTYTVTVTDVLGCTAVNSVTLTNPAQLNITGITSNDVSCNGLGDGSISLNGVTGGTQDNNQTYYYSWFISGTPDILIQNPNNNNYINNLSGNTYEVYVSDANNCEVSDVITITEAAGMTINSPTVTNPTCFDYTDGSINNVTISGGVTPYTYLWFKDGNALVSETNATITNIGAGDYTLEVTDFDGCIKEFDYTLTEPAAIIANVSLVSPISCNGADDASLTVDITPAGAYTVLWSGPNGFSSNSLTINSLEPGNYSVQVQDGDNCPATGSVSGDPNLPGDWTFTNTGVNHIFYLAAADYGMIGGTQSIAAGDYLGAFVGNLCVGYATVGATNTVLIAWANDGTTPLKDGFDDGDAVSYRLFRPLVGEFTNETVTYDAIPGTITNGTFVSEASSVINGISFSDVYPTSNIAISVVEPAVLVATGVATNITCNGLTNGSIDLSVTGGTTPYSYAWSNAATTQDISGLGVSTYTVTVTDFRGCTDVETVSITQPAVLAFNGSATITNVGCYGASTGSVAAPAIVGGTSPYTYAWSNGAITSTASTLAAGTYTVTVTDTKGCTINDSYTVTQPVSALSASGTTTNINCFGQSTGAIDVTVSGGTAPYTYAWSPSGNTQDLTSIAAGSYTVTVTDNNGCTTTDSYLLTQPVAALSFSDVTISDFNGYNVSCVNGNNGSISVTVAGGTSPYTYAWSTGATTHALNSLSSNVSYDLTVTDTKGCTLTRSEVLSDPDALSTSSLNTNVLCNGASTGAIDLSVSGGVSPYYYSWSTAANTQDISSLSAGTYTVTVTDDNFCQTTSSFTITESSAIAITETFSNFNGYEIQCNGGTNGEISLAVSGGTSPFTYAWSHSLVETSNNPTSLATGSYTVTVTDAYGCTATETYTLDEPQAMVVQVSPNAVACNGLSNGSIDVTISNAIGDLTIDWTGNGGGAVTVLEANNDSYAITGLAAGTYTVTVQDENTCTAGSTAAATPTGWAVTENTGYNHTMAVPVGGSFEIAPNVPVQNGDYLGVFFMDGATEVCGGYIIYNGVNNAFAVWGDDMTTVGTKEGFDENEEFIWKVYRPFAGEFDATVTYFPVGVGISHTNLFSDGGTSSLATMNSNVNYGAINITTAVVTEPDVLSVSLSANNVQCNGGSTTITSSVIGGTENYSYSWTGGATTANLPLATDGTYDVTVTDVNGCTDTDSYTVTEPAVIAFSVSTNNVLCFGDNTGSASIASASGGYGSYTYNWEAGPNSLAAGTYSVTLTDAEGCTAVESFTITEPDLLVTTPTVTNVLCNTNSTGEIELSTVGGTTNYTYTWSVAGNTNTISNLAAGTYSVTVEDAHGCQNIHSYTVTEPTALAITSATISDFNGYGVSCATSDDGSVDITVTGGVSPYTYLWSDGQTTQDAIELVGGALVSYDVTITDDNNCTLVSSSYAVTAPAALTANATVTSSYNTNVGGPFNTTCNGMDGSAEVTAGGGVGSYSYAWSNLESTSSISQIAGGTYTVTVTDGNGCTVTDVITVTTPGPVNVTALAVSDYHGYNVSCYNGSNGSIQLDWDGGVGDFDIYWVNWANNSNLNVNAQTITVNTFPAGTFYAVVVDANGCANTSNNVTLNQPTEITLPDPIAFAPTCHNGNDASIDLTGTTGGYSSVLDPFTASWFFPSNIPFATGLVHTGLLPEITYTGQITDGNGCSKLIFVTTPNISQIEVTDIYTTDVLCNGAATGEISADVIGGHGGYTFSTALAGTYTSNGVTGLTDGTYTLYVKDAQGCTINEPGISITENTLIVPTESITHVSCNGNNDGAIAITTIGGVAPYTYAWSNGAVTDDILSLIAGDYTVTITDAVSCERVFTYTVTQPDQLVIDNAAVVNAACYNGNTGSVTLTIDGGTLPYAYTWSNGDSDNIAGSLTDGIYDVTVTDAHNCIVTGSYTITEPADYTFTGTTTTNVSCNGLSDGAINLSIQGGTGVIGGFSWSNLAVTEDITNLAAGTYTVTFADANNCPGTTSYTITEPDLLTVGLSKTDITCFNYNDGTIDATIGGGTIPYTILWSSTDTDEDLSALSSGNYTITVTDAHGCTASNSIAIVNPAEILLGSTITPVSCFGGNNGEIVINVTNGVGALSYAWTGSASATATAATLVAGTYAVTVTDEGGCFASLGGLTVAEPTLLTSSVDVIAETCVDVNDGQAMVTGVGGNNSQPYSYAWSIAGAGVTDFEFGIEPGTYTVTVTDYKGCTSTSEFTIDAAIPMSLTLTAVDASCQNNTTGSVSVVATGGTGTYSYLWTNNSTSTTTGNVGTGTYFVTVTDGNSCEAIDSEVVGADFYFNLLSATTSPVSCFEGADGSISVAFDNTHPEHYSFQWENAIGDPIGSMVTNSYTTTLTNQVAGLYNLVVYAYPLSIGCSIEYQYTISEPNELLISNYAITDALCYKSSDGAIDITVTGGNGGNTYVWSKGASYVGFTQDITGLRAATYQVNVTDSKGCSVYGQAVVGQPAFLTSSYAATNVSCFNSGNGAIDLTVIGGTSPYTYSWTGAVATQDRSNLAPGTYTVTITDSHGCVANKSVTITQPDLLAIGSISQTIQNCDDVTLESSVSGGTLPYYFNWADNNTYAPLLGQNDYLLTNTEATYYLKVVDGNGCIATATSLVDLPAAMSVVASQIGNTSAAQAAVTGGTTVTNYAWSNGVSGANFNMVVGLLNGNTYTVTVTDANGCTASDDVSIVIIMPGDENIDTPYSNEYLESNGLTNLEMVVYPNPSTDGQFHITLENADINHSRITVLDALGRVVPVSVNSQNAQLELRLPATVGVYYLQLVTESNAVITKQLIISE